jgi:hypothetical protein
VDPGVHIAGQLGPGLGQRVVVGRRRAVLDGHGPVAEAVAGDDLHAAGQDQAPDAELDGRLADVVEAHHVRPQQHVDEVGRIRVGAEMDDRVGARDGTPHRVAVAEVADDVIGQVRGRSASEPPHGVAAPQQVAAQRAADRTGRPRHQHALRTGRAICHRAHRPSAVMASTRRK